MMIKLKEGYNNDFLTTVKGNAVFKDKWVVFDEDDHELEKLLDSNIFIVKEEEENKMEEKQVIETPVEEIISEEPVEEIIENVEEIQEE